ncbi:MAG TPA: pyruvate kinase [Porticoccaceae bacterium]|nr:pyruvate kinase [Porticoccaceae bacterium]
MRKTKIICTIGPATESADMLDKLAAAGMNLARLNLSHGDHASHGLVIRRIQELNARREHPVAILVDTQGPEIRTGDLAQDLNLHDGDEITVVPLGETDVETTSIQVNYADLITDVGVGDKITLDNGLINLEVLSKGKRAMRCRVTDGGVLKSKRHVNLPGIRVNLPGITEKDKRDIVFARELGADFIALSFVRSAADIAQARELLGADCNIKLIAKIENQEALTHLEAIIAAADGVMVARGDLGVEIPIELLPRVQRRIVRLCAVQGKRVIVATHMLESMIENPTPTRAEVTDVANAVYEEADAIMLSGETTVGKYPVRCVEMLDRIARSIENSRGLRFTDELVLGNDKQQVAAAAVRLAESIGARAIIVPTRSGRMASYVTNCHPQTPLICAFAFDAATRRQLALNRNVQSYCLTRPGTPEQVLAEAGALLAASGQFAAEDKLVVLQDILAGAGVGAIQIRTLGELIPSSSPVDRR